MWGSCCSCCQIICFNVFSCDVSYDFRAQKNETTSRLSFLLFGVHVLFIYLRILRSSIIQSVAGPDNPTSEFQIFSGVLVAPSLVFCVLCCGSSYVLLSFFVFWYLGTVVTLNGVMLSVQENKHQGHCRSSLYLLYHVISTFEIMKSYIMLPACSIPN